jgi:hypothetical protein
VIARRGLLLAGIAAILGAAAPSAEAGQFASDGFGLAGAPGGDLKSHANQFFRDGLASDCTDDTMGGSPITTTERRAYKSRAFTSLIHEPVCVTVGVTAAPTCAAPSPNEVMSETYSPSFNPEDIAANWIGDLGNSPPTQASYQFVVPAGAQFETVVDEVLDTANCGGVDLTWSSDRPWARGRPFPSGLPAVGQTLSSTFDVWPDDPAVARQWKRCDAEGANCSDLPGATGQSYVLTDDDIGHTIGVDESATEGGLTSTVDGRTTTRVFVPAVAHPGQSLDPGDSAFTGRLGFTPGESRCESPQAAPPASGSESRFYDVFGVTSLINEPACLWIAQIPRSDGLLCGVLFALYSPEFHPADLQAGYVGDDPSGIAFSATLAAGASAQAIVYDDGFFHSGCQYGLMIGSDAPFATARPQVTGTAAASSPVTTTTGGWDGTPAFAYGWRRCDASGGGCVPIDGATSSTYTPTGADVGSTLRSRVTATRGGRSASSDSAPTGVVAPAALDRTAPRGTVRLGSKNLAKAVKSGRIPLRVTCNERCSAAVEVRVTRKQAKALRLGRKRVIAKAKGPVTAGRGKTLRAKLTAKARRALRRRNALKLTLAARFTDTAGNRSRQVRKGALKRPAKRRR